MKVFTSVLMILVGVFGAAAQTHTLVSPDKSIEVSVTLGNDNVMRYEVHRNGVALVSPSATGLALATTTMNAFNSGISAEYASADEIYFMPHGKARKHHNLYNELILTGNEKNAQRNLTVRFRAYDNAVAFRYELTNRQGAVITADLSEFNFAGFEKCWAQTYHSDYSWYYECRDASALAAYGPYNVPVLVKCGADNYVLLTESASTAAMAASAVVPGTAAGSMVLSPAGKSTVAGADFRSPWRTLIIGSLEEIVESNRMTDLNESPDDSYVFDWVKPGRVAWNWGAEDGDMSPDSEQAMKYIDMAAHMGWEYFLLDDGWDGRINLDEVCSYADERGVGLFLWSHQNRFASDYASILPVLRQWSLAGVKGVKIDFFEDDSQSMLAKYENILRAAADCGLMVNFHGCTKPSGLERTWPNLMTSEAVLGGEFYMFNTTMTPGSHTVNLVLTRNVLGSMDYTPVKFGNRNGRVITDTSWAYQLALSVAFESALQCFCDTPANICGSVAEPFLRQVPAVWDELVCLEAEPDSYVSIARRAGSDWWLATLTSTPRTATLALDFLDAGSVYYAHIFREGTHRSDIEYECMPVRRGDALEIASGANSGAAVIISRNEDVLVPRTVKMEAEKYNRYGERISNGDCSGGACVGNLSGSRKQIVFTDVEVPLSGVYNLTLFYISEGARDAYVSVNDGEKLYYNFADTGGSLYFVTLAVELMEGSNTIAIGNENAVSPAFDRAVVTWYEKAAPGMPASATDALADHSMPEIRLSDTGLTVDMPCEGTLSIYSLSGVLLERISLGAGCNSITAASAGPVIANVLCGNRSVSVKTIIPQ